MAHTTAAHIEHQRWRLLQQVVHLIELPMAVLGVLWMILLAVDVTRGLHGSLARASGIIWIIFVVDFLGELAIAPKKLMYLKHHWLVAVSLVVPALRVVRFAGIVRLARYGGEVPIAHTLAASSR